MYHPTAYYPSPFTVGQQATPFADGGGAQFAPQPQPQPQVQSPFDFLQQPQGGVPQGPPPQPQWVEPQMPAVQLQTQLRQPDLQSIQPMPQPPGPPQPPPPQPRAPLPTAQQLSMRLPRVAPAPQPQIQQPVATQAILPPVSMEEALGTLSASLDAQEVRAMFRRLPNVIQTSLRGAMSAVLNQDTRRRNLMPMLFMAALGGTIGLGVDAGFKIAKPVTAITAGLLLGGALGYLGGGPRPNLAAYNPLFLDAARNLLVVAPDLQKPVAA